MEGIQHPAPPNRPVSSSLRWIPIRTLAEHHRPRILKHLLALGEHDRYLRFGHAAVDEQIERYVESIDFAHDEVFGVLNRRLDLVAMGHLAAMPGSDGLPSNRAEFGVSVAHHLRGRGVGERLFEHAILHARNRGVVTLLVHALSENSAMLHIARASGARVERSGAESQAVLELEPDSLVSHVGALVEEQAARLDYGLKRQVQRVDHLLAALTRD